MAKTSLILTTTDILGRKQQKSFTDINPEADTAALKTFAQMCNNLTTNTYIQTDRIDKINCDTEAGTPKTTPTFTVNKTTFSKAGAGNPSATDDGYLLANETIWGVPVTINYDGDGHIYSLPTANNGTRYKPSTANNQYSVEFQFTVASTTLPQTIQIGATETDNYKAATPITLTFTA